MWWVLARVLLVANFAAATEVTTFQLTGEHSLIDHGRIVGGSAASEAQWPWQVAIYKSRSQGSYFFVCGGSLIGNNYVLSAAHCFTDSDITGLLLRFGVHDITNPSEHAVDRYANTYRNHEDYSGTTLEADISLLYFSEGITYSYYIQPIGLPASNITVSGGETCVVSGFGDTMGTGTSFAQMRYANVDIIDLTTCNSWYSAYSITVTDDHICAGFEAGGIDSCQGDSGGPLICPVSSSSDSLYVIQGITSFGSGCAQARRPGAYTGVQSYIDWIVLYTNLETGEGIELIPDPGNSAMHHGAVVYSWIWLILLHGFIQHIVK